MAHDGPTADRKGGPPPPPPPLPKSVHRHGGVERIEHGLHVQVGSEKHPHVETGADEGGRPTLDPLPDRQQEIRHREHRRDDFDPTRVAPCTHERARQCANHWGADSGGAKPGSTFMTNTSCGAPAAERAISSVRTAMI